MKKCKFLLSAIVLTAISAIFQSCIDASANSKNSGGDVSKIGQYQAPVLSPEFSNYWFQGKAEISTFEVQQERYGEMRAAEQVNVFVTEDFSARKQVKLDNPETAGDDRIAVLKLNSIRRFETGIYDYSVMQSVFTPIETSKWRTLKTTTTIQDWCGHVFVQFNVVQDGYRVRQFSYFEKEGDAETELRPGLLEEEIFTLLRLSPEELAEKETTVVPGMVYSRFRHKPIQAEKAKISVEKRAQESLLKLVYDDIPRKLEIRFETDFPHKILGWEEFDNGKTMSKSTLKKTILDDYWKHNDNASAHLRSEIELKF